MPPRDGFVLWLGLTHTSRRSEGEPSAPLTHLVCELSLGELDKLIQTLEEATQVCGRPCSRRLRVRRPSHTAAAPHRQRAREPHFSRPPPQALQQASHI